jgi:YD repeat-containing protein
MRTDRDKHGLKGPVKSVHVETARLEERDGRITEKPWVRHTVTFDQEGRLIEQVNRNPDGSEWRTVNDYSDSGQLLARKVYDPSSVPSGEWMYVYDVEGRLVAEQYTAQDGRVTTPTTYAYDGDGRKVKTQEYDLSGGASVMIGIEATHTAVSCGEARRVETRYDDHGEAVEVKVFNADGALVSRVEITRDALGNPLEEAQYVGDVFPLGPCASDSCSAEEVKALTEEQQAELAAEVARLFSPGTAMSKHTHRYDTEGRLVESKLTMMGMEASRQAYTYDDAGNRSEEASYGEDGKLASKAVFTRQYDGRRNWTQELVSTASSWDAEFGLSTPAQVTRRRITYW